MVENLCGDLEWNLVAGFGQFIRAVSECFFLMPLGVVWLWCSVGYTVVAGSLAS